ncbi:hypothetical protein NLI96_g12761 [Meripilus lineatus]|uniref:RRM domain-containing protein n=1 Tax=Meripilus lineatus TaxID=2056292 RepID=A0AAD5UTZ4_9APHY|nr:hypothetical protein NLI96_g12761 [Physisporinus lineatus]
MNVPIAACFVKGVVDSISDAALKATLTQRFGPIKEIEIHRQKACAFLEFERVDSTRRAIAASLPVNQGGEGGVRIGTSQDGSPVPKVYVETRKERNERGPPRGGAANGGDNRRGGYRGGRGGGYSRGGRGGQGAQAK